MLSVSALQIVGTMVIQAETGIGDLSTSQFYYASRLVGALLLATLVPLLVDRRARRSSRVIR